jgi:hypothetical protein
MIERMKRVVLACVVLVVGCSKGSTGKSDPAFDGKWQQATAQAEPLYVESQRGGGLLGEVRRAIDPPMKVTSEAVQGPLPDAVVAGVIKRNLPIVKGCYEVEERAGTVGSGKAIVTLDIDPAGTVQNVSVDAPAFSASNLPACLTARARLWTFPKFTQGPKKFSYPFVFVGG